MRFALRSQTEFHECPQCRSRSVWKADPYGSLESILHRYLKLSPYRCARCDCRFLDSKIPSPDVPKPLVTRCFERMRGWVYREPFHAGGGLKLSTFTPSRLPRESSRGFTQSLIDHSLTAASGTSPANMREKPALRPQGDGAALN